MQNLFWKLLKQLSEIFFNFWSASALLMHSGSRASALHSKEKMQNLF
jgi:hypothetical protein